MSIVKRFESLTQYDARVEMKEYLVGVLSNPNPCDFKVYCADFILCHTNGDTTNPLYQGVMVAIDWENLSSNLTAWLEDADVGEDESKTESETECAPVPVPEKAYEQTKNELMAKMVEIKRIVDEKNEAYAMLTQIAAELNALSRC